jgi:hypothetical protein
MGYGFTRAWGAISIGIGWVILVGVPIVAIVLALALQTRTAEMQYPDQPLTVPIALVIGLIVGFLLGGICIVSGQLLRIAVHSLHLQTAMLERLDELATPRADDRPGGGRFTTRAGD